MRVGPLVLLASWCVSLPAVRGGKRRHVVATLSAAKEHTGSKGKWGDPDWCPPKSYAASFDIKVHEHEQGADNTGLNGITLICKGKKGMVFGKPITSLVGDFGEWTGEYEDCPFRDGVSLFLDRFRLLVVHEDPDDSDSDDEQVEDLSNVNNIRFACGRLDRYSDPVTMTIRGKHAKGHWLTRSDTCPLGSAICGLMTRVQSDKGRRDDTGLNDVEFYCCDD